MIDKAKERIQLRDRLKNLQSNFRNLWQNTADLIFPQTYPILETHTPGHDLMSMVHDTTAIIESENMASGLSNNIMPPGQLFYALRAGRKELNDIQRVRRYLGYLTEQSHEALFNSNFITQIDNVLQAWLTFGTGNVYSEWTVKTGLNFREYPIGMYQCIENAQGIIDTNIVTCKRTALQCVEEWGRENVGEAIAKAYDNAEKQQDKFDIVWIVRPRRNRNGQMLDNMNMPWESVYVAETDKHTIFESGYPEYPFHTPRYKVMYGEVYGRGLGTMALRSVRYLNRLRKDFAEMSNKWVNPPREVLESVDGTYDVTPGAINYVTQIPSSQAVFGEAKGAYPVGKDIIEYEREAIKEMFFKNVFETLAMLGKGDRRNELEIIERLKEGMKKLSKPIGRLFNELFDSLITRSVLLLIRNGQLPQPPEELQGEGFKIEYHGPLALALRDQQASALMYWVNSLGAMQAIFPGIQDNVEYDKAARDLGDSLGVKTDHIRPLRERDEIRKMRAEEQAKREALEMAQIAAQGYGQITKAPEPGSAAEQVQEAIG